MPENPQEQYCLTTNKTVELYVINIPYNDLIAQWLNTVCLSWEPARPHTWCVRNAGIRAFSADSLDMLTQFLGGWVSQRRVQSHESKINLVLLDITLYDELQEFLETFAIPAFFLRPNTWILDMNDVDKAALYAEMFYFLKYDAILDDNDSVDCDAPMDEDAVMMRFDTAKHSLDAHDPDLPDL